MLGFFRASSSQIEFAPALETTISAIAKISLSSFLTYSNCLYPGTVSLRLSIFSFPQICTTLKLGRSLGRAYLTVSLTDCAPSDPPITIRTGLSSVKPHSSFPACLDPMPSSSLIGVPVRTALSAGRSLMVSGKLQQILLAPDILSLLASPGVISDSWTIYGILRRPAALTTGTLTYPPFEKTMSGWIFLRRVLASDIPFKTLKGSEKFLGSKYLLSLPVEIPKYGML